MKGEAQRLRAELRADLSAYRRQCRVLSGLTLEGSATDADRALAAVALHHGYGAIETALARVSRFFDGSLPQGPDRHRQLIDSMRLDLEDVRPAVISPRTLTGLHRLLAFRHFFRHAYAAELDPIRLASVATVARELEASLVADFAALDDLLAKLAV